MKKYIRAMAFTRQQALTDLTSRALTFQDHVLKILIYQNTTHDLAHWITELTNHLYEANRKVLKGGKRLKVDDYIYTLFGYMNDKPVESRRILTDFRYRYVIQVQQYPDFQITKELCIEVSKSFTEVVDTFSKAFSHKNNWTYEDIKNMLTSLLC